MLSTMVSQLIEQFDGRIVARTMNTTTYLLCNSYQLTVFYNREHKIAKIELQ